MLDQLFDRLPKNLTPLLLRIGLAIVFLYAAIASLVNSTEWVGYLPPFAGQIMDPFVLLKIFSVYEVILALWLLTGWQTRLVALLCAATLGGIITSNLSLLIIVFRDVALFFAALALACVPKK